MASTCGVTGRPDLPRFHASAAPPRSTPVSRCRGSCASNCRPLTHQARAVPRSAQVALLLRPCLPLLVRPIGVEQDVERQRGIATDRLRVVEPSRDCRGRDRVGKLRERTDRRDVRALPADARSLGGGAARAICRRRARSPRQLRRRPRRPRRRAGDRTVLWPRALCSARRAPAARAGAGAALGLRTRSGRAAGPLLSRAPTRLINPRLAQPFRLGVQQRIERERDLHGAQRLQCVVGDPGSRRSSAIRLRIVVTSCAGALQRLSTL
jgi:hypothetical protein